MFYTAPRKRGTIFNDIKTANIKKQTISARPVNISRPVSLAQFQKEIEVHKQAIADLDRQQYDNMLKSGNDHNKLEAIKTQHEAALKELQGAYANAMGLGERKPKNQLLAPSVRKVEEYNNTLQQPERSSARTSEGDKAFWDGFKRGMGLKEGEELGQESASGRPRGLGFAANDTPVHTSGLNGEEEPQAQQSDGGGQFSSFQYGYSDDNPSGDEVDTQESSGGGQFSSFVYGYSDDNTLLEDEENAENESGALEQQSKDVKDEMRAFLEARGYDVDEMSEEELAELLIPGVLSTQDRQTYIGLMREWEQTQDDIATYYADPDLGSGYDLTDTEYLKGLVAAGETCFNLGNAGALNAFLEKSGLTPEQYYSAVRMLKYDLGDGYDAFVGGLPGAADADTGEEIAGGTNPYISEEEAATAFAEQEIPETGKDHLERGAVIIHVLVPVLDENGNTTMEDRYILGDTFVGNHSDVIGGLFSTYAKYIPFLEAGGHISFVHTHPYCTGHMPNEFSGESGDTVVDIAFEAARRFLAGEDFGDFGHYLGDEQVPWLPGVERMYLASPTEHSLYACDSSGPILDSNGDYQVMGTFGAEITNQFQE